MSISQEVNATLCQTGPNTSMGRLFRRYWIPLLISSELPDNDGAPLRVTVLSEKLLAFRNTDGTVGLIDEFCAHRGVSLWFGRNEEHGIRCPYHGWKYDVNGQCVDVPSEDQDSGYAKRIQLTSYPCVEQGGVIWAYMGKPSEQPPLPKFEWNLVPSENRYVSKRLQECNYMQAMEGGIDSSHVSFLHSGELHTAQGHQRRQISRRQKTLFRSSRVQWWTAHRCQKERRAGFLLLANLAMDHALVHHDSTLW